MLDRIKLQVIEVSEPKEVGQKGARKLAFKGKSPDGKELSYFTFRPTLFDAIKVGTEIDAEIEVKTRDVDGNIYTDRQISQIFVGGQAVGGQKSQWQSRSESPEQRISIEAQVAIKTIAELRIANALTDNSPEYKAMLAWCRERLGVVKIATGEKPKTKPADIAQADKDAVELFGDGETKPKPPLQPTKSKTEGVKPIERTEPLADGIPATTEALLAWVCKAKAFRLVKTAHEWLLNVCKIAEDRIVNDPAGVYNEVREII